MTSMAISMGATPRLNLSGWLLRIFDGLLAAVVFIAPLFMGGRHPVGELVYVTIVCAAACTWCARSAFTPGTTWRSSHVEVILAAAIAVLALQLVSWSPDGLARIAPLSSEILPLWTSSEAPVRLGQWSTISLTPHATRGQLVVLIAHVMLFVLVVQRVQSAEDVARLLRWVALAAVAMAILGLLQLFAGNGKFMWIYEHPSRTTDRAAKGMFANENHFASFLAIGLAPLIAWISSIGSLDVLQQQPSSKRVRNGFGNRGPASAQDFNWISLGLLLALGTVAFAGLLTFSRGGVLVLAVAGASVTFLLVFLKVLGRRALIGLGATVAVVAGALYIFGAQPLAGELETLAAGDLKKIDHHSVRTDLWKADLNAVTHSLWLGTGAGSHADIYPVFLDAKMNKTYTHAESGYVHTLLETGIVGMGIAAVLLVTAIAWAAIALWRTRQGAGGILAAAVLASLVASAFHSIADFVWYIPACMSMTIILAGCAGRLWQLSRLHNYAGKALYSANPPAWGEYAVSGFGWAVAAVVLVGISALMISNRTGPALASFSWERFRALRRAEIEMGEEVEAELIINHLSQTVAHDPHHARAHVHMAAACIRHFEVQQQQSDVPMPLSQIRDAAVASNFATKEEQDAWVKRVTGDNRQWLDRAMFHAFAALQACPLHGEAYTVLTEVAFLHGPSAPPHSVLLDQALLVRPHDAHVLFAAGREAALQGEGDKAIELWKDAFHDEPQYRSQIIAMLAPQLTPQQMVEYFEPQPRQLVEIYKFYRVSGLTAYAVEIAPLIAQNCEAQAQETSGEAAARLWNEAFRYYDASGDEANALRCIAHAVSDYPLNYDFRRDHAEQLLKVGKYNEAVAELRWCRQQRRSDVKVQRLWEQARRGPRLDVVPTTAAESTNQPAIR